MSLAFDLAYSADDPAVEIFAQLSDPAGALAGIPLTDGSPVDISAYAGSEAELLFAVNNLFGAEDSLTIGDIRIRQVPAPSPWLLLAVGLGMLRARHLPRPARR